MSPNAISPEDAARHEQIEQLRWHKFPVLNDGFVCLVDVMGDDAAIVQAARVSYGEGTRRNSDDRTLLRYLMRHRHTTPLEMAEIKLLVRVPMDTWRQWIRHRTASVNEYSTRYSIAIDSMYQTPPDGWRTQSTTNRQGSADAVDPTIGAQYSADEQVFQDHARQCYEKRIADGIAREQARKDLPLSTYTEAYWKIDLHNLLHFLSLRMELAAQWEIRQYSVTIGEQIVRPLFPVAWDAFLDYHLGAMTLSALEQDFMRALISHTGAVGAAMPATSTQFDTLCESWHDGVWTPSQRCREREECREKLQRLGIVKGEE